ncbi:hypothetical protein [Alkalitalea saponilacus]|uniref:Uncharacterized protein n=1 Tax=Alkalitalea saponilacus TaxID=889453 RepID=A0A1T5F5S1_9BACT|nr:hypothetical protein [Alkalitalea saponilacus]SKB91461.1 hypothetical protein SAMN03080601_01487 [Alkalitalea saponilacus]
MKRNFEDSWYLNIIMGFVALVLAFLLESSYEKLLLENRELPRGKGPKLGLLILRQLDDVGGKSMVLSFLILIALFCFWWAYKKFMKEK